MPLDDPILQFLAQPDNLPLVLEISKKVERLKAILHKQFWPALTAELRHRLNESEYNERWYIDGPEKGNEFRDWAAASIQPFPPKDQTFVYPRIEHGTPRNDYHFSYGICWSKHNNKNQFDTETVRQLYANLNQQGFRTTEWWPGNISLDIWARREKFLRRMANEEEKFIKDTADLVWNLFIEYEPLLTKVNNELALLE